MLVLYFYLEYSHAYRLNSTPQYQLLFVENQELVKAYYPF